MSFIQFGIFLALRVSGDFLLTRTWTFYVLCREIPHLISTFCFHWLHLTLVQVSSQAQLASRAQRWKSRFLLTPCIWRSSLVPSRGRIPSGHGFDTAPVAAWGKFLSSTHSLHWHLGGMLSYLLVGMKVFLFCLQLAPLWQRYQASCWRLMGVKDSSLLCLAFAGMYDHSFLCDVGPEYNGCGLNFSVFPACLLFPLVW